MNDSGLSRDRTALAWTRSALAIGGSGILIVRAALSTREDTVVATSAAIVVAVALLAWRGMAIHRTRTGAGGSIDLHRESLLLLTTASVLVAVLAAAVTIAL